MKIWKVKNEQFGRWKEVTEKEQSYWPNWKGDWEILFKRKNGKPNCDLATDNWGRLENIGDGGGKKNQQKEE